MCAFERLQDTEDTPKEEPAIKDAWSIAGEFSTTSGRSLNPKQTRLKGDSDRQEDDATDVEGLSIQFNGGIHDSQPQRFMIDLVCDKDAAADDPQEIKYVYYKSLPGSGDDKGKTFDVLKLKWTTKHACEDEASGSSSSGWGFFTWLIIM